MKPKLILASQSPRRQELLAQLGYKFDCYSADIDESVAHDESPFEYVERLAIAKAQVAALKYPDSVVLGSDTSVIIDNTILGKPSSLQDSLAMLSKLSGREHQVLTSIAVIAPQKITSKVVSTHVYFKQLTEQEIINYWHTKEPEDKAGSYGIQGAGAQFVEKIEGCYFSVVGLPLFETAQMLAQHGLATPIQQSTGT